MRQAADRPTLSLPRPEWVTAALIVLLLAIDGLAIGGIVAARREARQALHEELLRELHADARSADSLLATLRADLVFLASSPRLAETRLRTESSDPLSRRWARLETESTLLLFAQGHLELSTLALTDASREFTTWIERQPGTDPSVVAHPPVLSGPVLQLTLEVEDGGSIEATVDPARVVQTIAPDAPLELVEREKLSTDGEKALFESVHAKGYVPERLVLLRTEDSDPGLQTIERLADRYRGTVLLNLLVVSLGLPLGALALRSSWRAARLAAQREIDQDRREMERRLWHQDRLATVGRLTSRIAHELNNPLAGMSNHFTLLEEDLSRGDFEAVSHRVPKLREGMERIATTVRRALTLSEPGREEWQPVDLSQLAKRTVSLLEEVNPRVEIELAAEPSVLTVGDAAALAQVLTNLLMNALHLQQSGGRIQVSVRRESSGCVVEVADRGPGIAPGMSERMFEPFVSGRGSTGLGLTVSRSIVREHGGTIVASNRAGGGARFSVWLPGLVTDGDALSHLPHEAEGLP